MAKSKSDMENSWLSGKAKFESCNKQYVRETTQDERELLLKTIAQGLMNMPPGVHDYYSKTHPDAWKQVKDMAKKKGA